MYLAVIVLLTAMAVGPPAEEEVVGLPLTGEEAVEFLRTAEVVGQPEDFDPVAITEPVRVSLTDGTRTLRAIFKDEDRLYPRFRFGDGRQASRVKDSYRHEIAAYELDALLGLGLVPPCVERSLFSRKGSLCLWVENAMTESERRKGGFKPPDAGRWNRHMVLVILFQQLIWDHDAANIRNLVVDDSFRVYKVDSSMAFHTDPGLRNTDSLTRFPRALLEALEAVERSEVDARLGPWLTKRQLNTLWSRRNRILELAEARVAEHGETAVLY